MASDSVPLEGPLPESLRFEYQSGGIAHLLGGHSTGWRSLPGLMFSQAENGGERMDLPNEPPVLAEAGDLILLPAGFQHKVEVVGAQETRRWVHVNYYVFEQLDLAEWLAIPRLIRKPLGRQVGDLIEAWLGEDGTHSERTPLQRAARRQAFGFQLLSLIEPCCSVRTEAADRLRRMSNLRPVVEQMQREFGGELDRDALARTACLSPAQFHTVFKAAFGTSPMQYLLGVRLRHAQRQLIATDLGVAEIARQCGYPDPFVFSKFFKRGCGLAPKAYRRATREMSGREAVAD